MQQRPEYVPNIAAHLPEMARRYPDSVALHLPQRRGNRLTYRQVTFTELNVASDRSACALKRYGIERGMRTALMVPPSFEFFALTFALFKLGAIPVLIDPGMGVKNLKTCLDEASPEAFIGVPKAHTARLFFGWGRNSLHRLVTVGTRYGWGGSTLAALLKSVPDGEEPATVIPGAAETAAILFTSGSTGSPKGAVYSHGNFNAQVELLRQVYDIRPGEIDLPTFPLFALFAPALGMSAVIPEMDFTRPGRVDAARLCTAIETFNITTMFGSPALIRRIAEYGADHAVHLSSLKRVISAGAPVPAAVVERCAALLGPQAEIFTPYGATEALPVCSIGSREILGETRHATAEGAGVCIGRPVPGTEIAILPISDEAVAVWDTTRLVPDGVIGEICAKGPQVTASYFQRDHATSLAKITDPAGGFWHRMGDLGYRDQQGRLWFCGRKAHRVRAANAEFYTIPCEGIFNTHPQVFRTALVGCGPVNHQIPVLCVELKRPVGAGEEERILAELLELGSRYPATAAIRHIFFHPAFPVDIRHNAKIFREKLALWATGKLP